jgi:hypothetical protein
MCETKSYCHLLQHFTTRFFFYSDTNKYEYHMSGAMEILIPSTSFILASPQDCICLTRLGGMTDKKIDLEESKNKSLTNSLCNLPDVLTISDRNVLYPDLDFRIFSVVPSLPKRSWAMRRSSTKGTGPAAFARL